MKPEDQPISAYGQIRDLLAQKAKEIGLEVVALGIQPPTNNSPVILQVILAECPAEETPTVDLGLEEFEAMMQGSGYETEQDRQFRETQEKFKKGDGGFLE